MSRETVEIAFTILIVGFAVVGALFTLFLPALIAMMIVPPLGRRKP